MTFLDNEDAQQLNEVAGWLTYEGLYEEAVECLHKGLFLEPDNGYLWFNLALIYREQNRKFDSIQALEVALNLVSDDPDIWDTIGVALFELGEFEGAEVAFKNAFRHEKKSSRIWNNYGTLLFNQKKYKKAKDAFEIALILDQTNMDAFLNLYDTYCELNEKGKMKVCTEILKKLNSSGANNARH